MLSHADSIASGRIHHHYAFLRGGIKVHIIHAHASTTHNLQLGGSFKNSSIHFCATTNNESIVFGNDLEQILSGNTSAVINLA